MCQSIIHKQENDSEGNEELLLLLLLQDLSIKLPIESALRSKINGLLRRINNAFAVIYSETATLIDISTFTPELEALLVTSGRRASSAFIPIQSERLGGISQAEEVQAQQISSTFNSVNASQSSVTIIDNYSRFIQNSLLSTIAFFFSEEISIDNRSVAITTRRKLNSQSMFRATRIARTETQKSSEQAKQATAEAVQRQLNKQWKSVGDIFVRDKHAAASGQQVPFRTPFNVGGQLLMFPGDTRLGASIDNIVNCRCSSLILN